MKKTVAVLFGGVSSEHEVSLKSATSVLKNMDREKYDVLPVGITRDGRWYRYDGDLALIADGRWEQAEKTPAVLSPDASHRGLLVLEQGGWTTQPVDVIFPVLHGLGGEDGTVQGLAELAGLPCVGCGVMASANCMDKDTAKLLLKAAGIPVARWITAYKGASDARELSERIRADFGFPVFVKPANSGSSVGVTKAADEAELASSLAEAFRHDEKAIIEETVKGAEVESAVMGNREPYAARDVGEIVPVRELYDYEGKYLDGSTALFIPARIPDAQAQAIRETAVRGYRALSCRGFARVDFFALPDGGVVLNEINTIPGFTNISMFPKLFAACGVSFPEIVDRLIGLALEEGSR